ncbi:MAG: nucleotidyltransferase, partial [Melioribacteraceae bacterium]
MTIEKIRKRKEEILRLAELHGVKSVKIFGSVAKGLSTKGSDV